MKALSGKKTYFTAGAAVLTALGAYFAGEVDMQTTISALFASLMAIFLRKGITSEAKKAAAPAEDKPAE
jgi:hypothetical protein|tara:strand:+ start:108 stop:314 length:207 start_codon:yes stop_codon:yes gene_type:complete